MADVRCPMCGKSNPAEAELCQFCEARLKPLVAGAPLEDRSGSGVQDEPGAFEPLKGGSEDRGLDAGLPDWLQSLRQGGDTPPAAVPSDEELPGWLPDEAGPSAAADEPGVFDWLSNLRDDENTPTASEPDEAGEPGESGSGTWAADDSMPGWLLNNPASEESEPPAAEPPAVASSEEPDWLRDIQARQRPLGAGSAAIPAEWLEPEVEPPVEPKPGLLGFNLAQFRPSQDEPAEPGDEPVPPFTPDAAVGDLGELPDWLASLPAREAAPEEPARPAEASGPADLAPADLPTWLEAMRPVEAAAPDPPALDDNDRLVESSGPLSGLSGVLPAEPDIARSRKPAAYSVKLQVTDNQQAHAAVFEELIRKEGEARPIASRPVLSSMAVWRWIIFLVLAVGIAWPVWTASQDIPLPAFSPETDAASTLINGLAGGTPVLLAVDYQPGLSAEMDAASAAVVDHLMLKGAYLALVSTLPSGPLQAERLVGRVNAQGGHRYDSINQYANLGFIPGGSAGLLGFTQAPQRILPFALDGNYAWQNTPLQAIGGLEDFALVMVLTESAENARSWIEQVQPSLGRTPLVMVVSAQVEPVVRPYYEGRPQQVQGLVAGLAGGASYEGLQARQGLARKYWDSFSLGLLLAAALIVISGAVSAASTRLANRKTAEGEKTA